MTRTLLVLLLSLLTFGARAENPVHQCLPEKGCREQKGPTHDIGGGVLLTLPEGWTFFSYPQAPIPEMAGLREIRAFKGGVVIAITPLPNIDKRDTPEEWLREMHAKGTAQYVGPSKEGAYNFVSMSHDGLIGGYASFTAKNEGERPYRVLPNRAYASVTSFLISYRYVIFSVSVASEASGDENYAQALSALQNLK